MKTKALKLAYTSVAAFVYEKRVFLISVVLFFVTWKTFVACLLNGFCNYDDPSYVSSNSHVKQGLTFENVVWAFSSSVVANWHPLTMLTHILDWEIYGPNARGHHLLNVILHSFNCVLAFLVLQRSTGAFWRSFWVALFFGIHPLRVESVAWISERKDVLSTFFFLITILTYTNYALQAKTAKRRSKLNYYCAIAFLLLGLMSKPMLVTLPCVLLLLDVWPLKRWSEYSFLTLFKEKLPFFILSFSFSVLTSFTQHPGMLPVAYLPIDVRLENMPVAYCRYVANSFWPVNLACLYPYPNHWPIILVVFCTIVFVVVSIAVVWSRRRCPYAFVGWLWFIGTLFPVIGLMQTGTQSMADRYSYIPSIGLLILIVWSICDIATNRISRTVLSTFAVVVVVAFMLLTRRQIGYWKDGETLWRRAAAVTTLNYSAATIIGQIELARSNYNSSITNLQYALKLRRDLLDTRVALAKAFRLSGKLPEAIETLEIGTRIHPSAAILRIELARAWVDKGCPIEATTNLSYALRLDPTLSETNFTSLPHQIVSQAKEDNLPVKNTPK